MEKMDDSQIRNALAQLKAALVQEALAVEMEATAVEMEVDAEDATVSTDGAVEDTMGANPIATTPTPICYTRWTSSKNNELIEMNKICSYFSKNREPRTHATALVKSKNILF